MADENIEQLNIEINVSGADVADQRLKSMESRLKSIRNAVPSINSQMSELARSISNVGGGKKFGEQWEYLNNPIKRTISTIGILNREIERMQGAYADTESEEAQDRLRKKIESTQAAIERNEKSYDKMLQTAADVPSKQAKDWSYLNSELGRLQEKLKTETAHMQELKEAWQNASTGSEQKSIEKELDRTAQTIDRIKSKIGKLPESTAKMFSQSDAENFARMAEVATKDWDYLRSSTSILQSQIERLKAQIDELKDSWAKADSAAEQNKIAQQIENASSKLLNAQAKLNTMPKQGAEKFSQADAERFANLAKNAAKDWGYLRSPLGILEEQIRRITNETERYKKAWQETDDTEAQDKLASKIESNTEKLRKLNDEKAKLSEGGEGEATGFDGMLKNVQALSGMFGKTGGQIAGLLGKAEGLKSTFAGLAGTAGKFALPVALVVGSVAAIKGIVNEIKKTATTIWNVTKAIGKAIKNEVKKKIEDLIQPIQRLKKQIGRVVFNRLIREAFNIVQNGIAEGIKNVARGFERANVVLSEYTTQLMYLKNTLGAMIIPLLENLYPAFELVTNAVIKASNAINQFLSLLAGKTTYIKAKKQYVDYANSIDSSSKKAKKSVQNLTTSFDELHDITQTASDTGSEEDYTNYFTGAGIEANISDFYKRLRDGFKKGDLSSVGVDLANKVNAQLERMINLVKWDNVKDKITTKISAITSGLRSFLKTFINNRGFENLGRTVGSALDTVIQSLATFDRQMQEDLTTINKTVINGFGAIGVGIADTLYGFIMSIDWATLGELLIDKILNLFDIAKGFTARMLETVTFDGKQMTRIEAMVTNVMDGLAEALNEAIESDRFTSLGTTVGNMLITIFNAGAAIFGNSDFWENLATAVNNVISALTSRMKDKDFVESMTKFVTAAVNAVATLLSSIDIGDLTDSIIKIINTLSSDPQIHSAVRKLGEALGDISSDVAYVKLKFKLLKWKYIIEAFVSGLITWAKKTVEAFITWANSLVLGGEKSKALISAIKGIINKKKGETQEFATGGFPEDGLFYANHSELVGKFSNGKTAVANNEQIIKGIQRGVAQGIQDAGFNNQSSTTEMRGDIRIDGKKAGTYLAKSVGKELNRAGWKLRTT